MSALKGVNLGGWLVIEKWITPSLFKGVKATNHYQLEKTPAGQARLKNHYENFVTEADVRWLREKGVELLRVPFGYWVFGGEKPYQATIEQLDWIVRMAEKYGIYLLLDMHAAAGAQNDKAHAGSGNQSSQNVWLNKVEWQDRTIETLVQVARRYRNEPHVWGIELLNEPNIDVTGLKLVDFYRRAYKRVTAVARPGTRIIFSDAFHPLLTANTFGWLAKREYPVLLDTHIYYCFGNANKRRTVDEHIRRAQRSRWYLQFLRIFQPVLVGEWSAMLPYRTLPEKTAAFLSAQMKSYDKAEVWCYWTYKTEDPGRWNFRDMVETGQLKLLQ